MELLKPADEQHHNLRNNAEFTIPVIKSVYHGPESISFLGPKIWNSLPDRLKNVSRLHLFKQEIKNGILKIVPVNYADFHVIFNSFLYYEFCEFCLEDDFIFQFIIVYSEIPFGKGLHRMETQPVNLQSKSIEWFLYGAILFTERYFQRRIQKRIGLQGQGFLKKWLMTFGRCLFLRKALSRMFDQVLNTPLYFRINISF